MAALEITDLVVEYPSGEYTVRPIDGLSTSVEAGELALILGPSGCGKTTLLSCLGGILTPTAGSVRFGDIQVAGPGAVPLTDYRRDTVGIVFQAFNLIPSMTAVENVEVPLRAAGRHRRDRRARARELLDLVGLAERSHHRPGDLSGGQQQRVAIARALALDPPLILADEPTAHLDYLQVEDILRLLRELAAGERVVVVSTHDQRMMPLADRVIDMVPEFGMGAAEPERVELAAGEMLFHQGSWGELIYVVESGSLEVVRPRSDGTWDQLASLAAGQYFGETGPLFRLPRSASVRACTAAIVTGYSVREFRHRMGALGVGEVLADAGDAPTHSRPT
jgi:putative ABC transport system ATP-binding protein